MSMLVYGIIAARVNLTLLRELHVMVNLVIRRVFDIPKLVSVRNIYVKYNVQPVAVLLLRRLLSVIASLYLNDHSHMQKFRGSSSSSSNFI